MHWVCAKGTSAQVVQRGSSPQRSPKACRRDPAILSAGSSHNGVGLVGQLQGTKALPRDRGQETWRGTTPCNLGSQEKKPQKVRDKYRVPSSFLFIGQKKLVKAILCERPVIANSINC